MLPEKNWVSRLRCWFGGTVLYSKRSFPQQKVCTWLRATESLVQIILQGGVAWYLALCNRKSRFGNTPGWSDSVQQKVSVLIILQGGVTWYLALCRSVQVVFDLSSNLTTDDSGSPISKSGVMITVVQLSHSTQTPKRGILRSCRGWDWPKISSLPHRCQNSLIHLATQ